MQIKLISVLKWWLYELQLRRKYCIYSYQFSRVSTVEVLIYCVLLLRQTERDGNKNICPQTVKANMYAGHVGASASKDNLTSQSCHRTGKKTDIRRMLYTFQLFPKAHSETMSNVGRLQSSVHGKNYRQMTSNVH